ncbi:hypothetical protein ScPMuIL_004383 [Solemya velum]
MWGGSNRMINHRFNKPGGFKVSVTATNSRNSASASVTITVEEPIPVQYIACELRQGGNIIPLPDGVAIFSMRMTDLNPTPTNVKCEYDFGDNTREISDVDLTFEQPTSEKHEYTALGQYYVSIKCSNLVSNFLCDIPIDVKSFQFSDLKLRYRNLVGLNSTESVVVQFSVTTYDTLMRIPDGVRASWDFGDGTFLSVDMSKSHTIPHEYHIRGVYFVALTLTYGHEIDTSINKLELGVVNFAINKHLVRLDEPQVWFNASGLNGSSVNYMIYPYGLSEGLLLNETREDTFYNYTVYGEYWPKIIATNGTFTEIVILDKSVKTDYPIEILEMNVRNESIYFPDGSVHLTVELPFGFPPLPNLHCEIDFNESNDGENYNVVKNLTDTDPIAMDYTYKTLNFKIIAIYCYNLIDDHRNQTTVHVFNYCFTSDGMFDGHYGIPKAPLRAYTSMDVELSNRMEILCTNNSAIFEWTILRCKGIASGIVCNTTMIYTTPTIGTIIIERASLEEGLYSISLLISFGDSIREYATEVMYLNLEKRPPFAFIVGGFERNVAPGIFIVDSLTESFDVDGKLGDNHLNSLLEMQWECTRYNVSNISELRNIHWGSNSSVLAALPMNCSNVVMETSRGILQIGSPVNTTSSFIITVLVSTAGKNSTYTQLIVADGNPPDIVIKCRYNCMEKVAVSMPLKLDVNYSREEFSSSKIKWTLRTKLSEIELDLSTGCDTAALRLPEYFLEEGTYYVVEVTVEIPGRTLGLSAHSFYTNIRPYNGSCDVNPLIGVATETLFNIWCFDWLDEGLQTQANNTIDDKAVLIYTFLVRVERWSQHGPQNPDRVLTFGIERTTPKITLPMGNPQQDFRAKVVIQIEDIYGDREEINIDIKSKPPFRIPTKEDNDANSTDTVQQFFEKNSKKLNETTAVNNTKTKSRVIEAASSILIAIDTEKQLLVTEESSQWDTLGQDMTTPREDQDGNMFNYFYGASLAPTNLKLKDTVILAMVNLSQLVSELVSENSQSTRRSAIALYQLTGALNTLWLRSTYVSEDIAVSISESCEKLGNTILDIANQRPIPLGENLDLVSNATFEVLGRLLTSLVPMESVDIPDNIDMETVRKQMEETQSFNAEVEKKSETLTSSEKFYLTTKLLQREKLINADKKKTARKSVEVVRQAIWSITKALSKSIQVGQEAKVFHKLGLTTTMEKRTGAMLMNQTIDMGAVRLAFQRNNSIHNHSLLEEIDLEVTVYDKNPYTWDEDAKDIASRAVTVSLQNSKEQSLVLPFTLNLKNVGVPVTMVVQPKFIEGDRNRMAYIRTKYDSSHDIILYISTASRGLLYHVYFRSSDFPTTSLYDYRKQTTMVDLTPQGFKYFVPREILAGGFLHLGIQPNVESSQVFNTSDDELIRSNFTLSYVTTGCRVWNGGKEEWDSKSCQVSPESDLVETVCICDNPPGITFATTFYVPPNTIDFSTVFTKFDIIENGAVFGIVVALILLYIILLFWARRKDIQDVRKWSINFLVDTEESDVYLYLCIVYTGLRRGAGTRSGVNFILFGDESDSGIRVLSDSINKGFETGSVRQFVLGVPESLGELNHIRIWHDNMGKGRHASWYLHKIEFLDLQTYKRSVFMCEEWLSVDIGDGILEKTVVISLRTELKQFDTLFKENFRQSITDSHLWLSVIIRPERSSFIRTQRLSCLVALLFLTMITNAMFFKTADNAVRTYQIAIGPIKFSLQNIYISVIGILITTPPILLITVLFRKARRPASKSKTIHSKLKPGSNLNNANTDNIDYFLEHHFYKNEMHCPYCCLHFAWVLVLASILVPGCFLILYSMEWGKTKSEEWLSTFLFSFLESMLIVDPIQVILLSALVTLVLRSSGGHKVQKVNVVKIRRKAQKFAATKAEIGAEQVKIKLPMKEALITQQRSQRKQLMRAEHALIELILYSLFLAMLFGMSYSNRDSMSFFLKQNINQHLSNIPTSKNGFIDIRTADEFLTWFGSIFFQEFFPEKKFNGEDLDVEERAFFSDLSNFRLGPARLRQIRITEGKCPRYRFHECYGSYTSSIEDREDYCIGWRPLPCQPEEAAFHFTSPAWRFIPSSQIWGITIAGEYNIYGGGGYILNFDINKWASIQMLDELIKHGWLGRQTRAIFLEFTLYNPNINLFTYVIYLCEFPETGGIITWSYIQPIRIHEKSDIRGIYVLICQVTLVILFSVYFLKLLHTLFREKTAFFSSFWHIMDMFSVFICYALVAVFFMRKYYLNETLHKFKEDKKKFVDFQHIVVWDFVYNTILSFSVFFATLRVLKLLNYNQRMHAISSVIRNAASDLSGFFCVFIVAFTAFVLTGTLIFGYYLNEYRDFYHTVATLSNSFIGKNKLESMINSVPLLAKIYFFAYTMFIIMMLLNVFLSILNESITAVHKGLESEPEVYGVVNLLMSILPNSCVGNKKNDQSSQLHTPENSPRREEFF